MLPPDLTPGPALDARVGQAMGVEPEGWRLRHSETVSHRYSSRLGVERLLADIRTRNPAYSDACSIVPVYPTYSAPTGGAWEACAEWMEAQGYEVCLYRRKVHGPNWWCELTRDGNAEPVLETEGATLALAVCAAVLVVSGRGEICE